MNCRCGCGEAVAPGREYRRGHNRRLAVRYTVTESGCWIWNGVPNNQGYCHIKVGGQTKKAHRVMWEEVNGPIPGDLPLDHLCRNRACVNPAHLEPVTLGENNRRGLRTYLTAEQVAEIKAARSSWNGSTRQFSRVTALRYGVSWAAIDDIIGGRTWQDVAA